MRQKSTEIAPVENIILPSAEEDFCIYRLPQQKDFYFIKGKLEEISTSMHTSAFIVRPFEGAKIYSIAGFPQKIASLARLNFTWVFSKSKIGHVGSDKAAYLQLIQKALHEIEEGIFEKVVISDTRYFDFNSKTHLLNLFEKIAEQYPNAFVYLLNTNAFGCWLGASPELLLSASDRNIETLALAGTKSANSQNDFTDKEINEQKLVSDYICKKLEGISKNIEIEGPEIRFAGHLKHLATKFYALAKDDSSYLEIAEKLHPTPAVCGSPSSLAYDFIIENEGYPRELYTGYVGILEENKAQLFVNLRCMQLYENQVIFYGGGGIVKGSVPEQEFSEIEQKIYTLMQFFQQSS